jgi:predicted RNA-binding Zn ribbon-like protein
MPLTRGPDRGTGVGLAVDLVNTWDELEEEPDLIEGVRDVRYWLDWHGLSEAAKRVKQRDVERARELRSRFDRVFDAESESEAAELLNALAREYATPPQLERAGRTWRLRAWPDEREGLAAAAAYGTAGLLEAMRDLGWRRFGRCAGSPCRCAFVDRSRNRSRRYCCTLCADRVAQANYRERQKQGRPASGRRRGVSPGRAATER